MGADGTYRIQGSRKKLVLKSTPSKKGSCHRGYASIGVQIVRLKPTGGKDSGGEIVPMKYRISQMKYTSGGKMPLVCDNHAFSLYVVGVAKVQKSVK